MIGQSKVSPVEPTGTRFDQWMNWKALYVKIGFQSKQMEVDQSPLCAYLNNLLMLMTLLFNMMTQIIYTCSGETPYNKEGLLQGRVWLRL